MGVKTSAASCKLMATKGHADDNAKGEFHGLSAAAGDLDSGLGKSPVPGRLSGRNKHQRHFVERP
jgi:hypothetical protein